MSTCKTCGQIVPAPRPGGSTQDLVALAEKLVEEEKATEFDTNWTRKKTGTSYCIVPRRTTEIDCSDVPLPPIKEWSIKDE